MRFEATNLFFSSSFQAHHDYQDADICITSYMSKNGRLYLKDRDGKETLPPPPLPVKPEKFQFMFLEIPPEEMARVMTLLDYELFSRIDPLEFMFSIFKTKGQNTSNLNIFVNRFNEVKKKILIVGIVIKQKRKTNKMADQLLGHHRDLFSGKSLQEGFNHQKIR